MCVLIGEVNMNTEILKLILMFSQAEHLDWKVAYSIAMVESHGDMRAVGSKGERGAFQLLPKAYPQYTKEDLSKPEINVYLGVKMLAQLRKSCPFKDAHTYVVCYNRGVAGAANVGDPKRDHYYRKFINKFISL